MIVDLLRIGFKSLQLLMNLESQKVLQIMNLHKPFGSLNLIAQARSPMCNNATALRGAPRPPEAVLLVLYSYAF